MAGRPRPGRCRSGERRSDRLDESGHQVATARYGVVVVVRPGPHGAAVVVERVVLPPAAEEAMPVDPDEALAYLMAHPDRQDVRMAVGVLRSGESWCAVRTRANDADDAVAGGRDLVPGLVEAVTATFA